MINGLNIDELLINRINELISLKATKSESYFHNGESELFEFIRSCISAAEKGSQSLPSAKPDSTGMDLFFRKMLDQNDY